MTMYKNLSAPYKNLSAMLLCICVLLPLSSTAKEQRQSTVIHANEISWGYLNPLRGDKSPGAANLWGDRTKNTATGMLVRFNKGFSSPPHMHNISYRAVVINGLMHNDDPSAEKMWLPAGSFWTQPAGANHITAADGENNLIYLEIDSGPYLVKPSSKHFNNGEHPVNLHSSNLVWLEQHDLTSIEHKDVEVTYHWGSTKQGGLGGSMIKLPKGFKGKIKAEGSEFRAIVIKGSLTYDSAEEASSNLLASSYFSSAGKFKHNVIIKDETFIYVRTNGYFKVINN